MRSGKIQSSAFWVEGAEGGGWSRACWGCRAHWAAVPGALGVQPDHSAPMAPASHPQHCPASHRAGPSSLLYPAHLLPCSLPPPTRAL